MYITEQLTFLVLIAIAILNFLPIMIAVKRKVAKKRQIIIGNLLETDAFLHYDRDTTISTNPDGSLAVVVEVTWSRRGRTHSLTAQENIYDWK